MFTDVIRFYLRSSRFCLDCMELVFSLKWMRPFFFLRAVAKSCLQVKWDAPQDVWSPDCRATISDEQQCYCNQNVEWLESRTLNDLTPAECWMTWVQNVERLESRKSFFIVQHLLWHIRHKLLWPLWQWFPDILHPKNHSPPPTYIRVVGPPE